MRLITIILFHILTKFITLSLSQEAEDSRLLTCDFSDTEWEPLNSIHLYTCDIFTQSIDSIDYKINLNFIEHQAKRKEEVEGLRFTDNQNLNYLPENLQAFPNLQGLIAMKTYLTVINVNDLKGLKKLKYLNLANSDLKSIEEGVFRDLMQLNELDLSDSDIREIHENAFQGLSALKTLYLGANKLSQLDANIFNPLVSLESISLELNHLVEINDNLFAFNTKLADIWLNGNRITAMTWKVFENVKSLSYVDAQNNPCIDGVYDSSNFDDLKRTLEKKCAGTTKSILVDEITEIFKGKMSVLIRDEISLDGTLDDGKFSQYLKIIKSTDENESTAPINDPLTKLIECHVNPSYWRLSGKEISTCQVENNIIDAKDFKISGSGSSIKAMNFDNNKHIKYLPKNIGKFAPNLIEFSAVNSSIVLITNKNFADLRHLRTLNLANNNIKFIDPDAFDDLSSLEELDLSGNELESIDEELFEKLKNLKVLRIGSNKLHEIPKKLLRSLRNLVNFSISHQYVPSLDENLFKTNIKLKNIWMNSNKLKSISPNMFNNLKTLEYVDIRDNKCIDNAYDSTIFFSIKTDILTKCGGGYELKMGKKIEVKSLSTSKKKKNKKDKKKKKQKFDKGDSEEQKEVTCEYDDIFWPYANRTLRTCIINETIDDADYYLSANPIFFEEFVDTDKIEAISFANNKNIKFLPQNIGDVFPNLIEMSAANSGLGEVNVKNFKGLRKLKALNLAGNELISLTPDGSLFEDLIELEELNLDENELEEFDELTFKFIKKLRKLHLKGNKLKKYNSSWFAWLVELQDISFDTLDESLIDVEFFKKNPNLKWISMNGKFFNEKMEIIDNPEEVKVNSFGTDFSGIIDDDEEEDYEIKEIECLYEEITEAGEKINNNEVCSIAENEVIDHRHYVIKSSPKNALVKKFIIHNNKNAKFLPQNIGSSFPILEEIDVEGTSISTLRRKNFQNLPHLENLNLNSNRIKAFESDTFDDLNFLKKITLKGNQIEMLEEGFLDKLKNLRKVDLGNNALHYIHPKTFKFLAKLVDVSLNDNQISVIDEVIFKFNPNLEKLSLQNNKIDTMNPKVFKSLRKIKFIDLAGNNCINGIFDNIDEIMKILKEKCNGTTSGNNEVYCDVNNEENSDEICIINEGQTIDGNGFVIIVDPDILDANKVETLKIANNKNIRFLPENIGKIFPNLKSIIASNLSLESFPDETFKSLLNLKALDLSHNKLEKFNPNAFDQHSNLEEINLSENQINLIDDETFEKLPNLKKIDLSGNKINSVTQNAFNKLHNLETLVIDEDDEEVFEEIEYTITKIIKKKKKKIDSIDYDLDETTIGSIEEEEDKNNVEISEQEEGEIITTTEYFRTKEMTKGSTYRSTTDIFSSNGINCNIIMKFSKNFNNQLSTCDLSQQIIEDPDVAINVPPNNENIYAISIENNPYIKYFPENIGNAFPNLLELSAKNSAIESLLQGDFQNLDNIEFIDLSGNALKTIEPEIFDKLPKLTTLDLSKNQIEFVDEEAFGNLPSMKTLNLENNLISFFDPKTFENMPNLEFLNIENNKIPSLNEEIFHKNLHLKEIKNNVGYFITTTTSRTRRPSTTTTIFTTSRPQQKEKKIDYGKEIECEYGGLYWTNSDSELFTCDLSNAIIDEPNVRIKQSQRNRRVKGLSFVDNKNVKYLPINIGESFPALIEISAYNTSIRKVPEESLRNLPKLQSLNLMISDIEKIHPNAFQDLISLENLELSDNKISHLYPETFRNNPNIKSLYLNNNNLQHIDPKLFEKLFELRNISLESNKIPSVNRKLFSGNYELVNVWLNDNKIKFIDPTTFDGKRHLEYVDFRGNECINKFFVGNSIDRMSQELKKNCGGFNEQIGVTTPRNFEKWTTYKTRPMTTERILTSTRQIFYRTTTTAPILTTNPPARRTTRPRIPITTSRAPAKEINCKLVFVQHQSHCIIENQPIDDRGYVIKSFPESPYVTKLIIENDKNVKFLPENIPRIFPNLQQLIAKGNSIIDIFSNNVDNLPKLKVIDVSDNDLSIIDPEVLQNLPSLEELNLSSNHIPLIINETFRYLPKLNNLDLSRNEIVELNPKVFANLTGLKKVLLQNNKVFEIPGKIFESNPLLEEINLSGNKINFIDPNAFNHLSMLKEVNLGENECVSDNYKYGTLHALKIDVRKRCQPHYGKDTVDSIDPFGYGNSWGVVVPKEVDHEEFSNEIDIDDTWKPYDFIECDNIEEFSSFSRENLLICKIGGEKKISKEWKIEDSPRTKRVKRLAIKDNPNILNLPTNLGESFPNLIELEMANTSLKKIHPEHFKGLKNLKSLQLPGNSIKIIEGNSFIETPSLQNLVLSGNNLRDIDDNAFRQLPHLTYLDLSKNKLPKINSEILKNLPKLKTLDLSNNDIHQLPNDVFKFNPQLYSIDLSNNNINSIEPNTFDRLPQLMNLDLMRNECIDRKFTASSINSHQLKSVIKEHCQSHKSLKSELKTCQRLVENCKREVQTRPLEIRTNENREKENLRNLLQKTELKSRQLSMELRTLQEALDEEKELHRKEIEKVKHFEQEMREMRRNCAKIDESHNVLVDMECEFISKNDADYSCNARNFKVSVENSTLDRVEGIHKRGKRNADVTSLDISNQNIKFLPHQISTFFPRLKSFFVDNSNLSNLNRLSHPHLKYLTINNNNIHHIDPSTFNDLPQLEHLDLSQNHIKKLPTKVFEMLPNLRELNLADNSLTALPHDIIPKVNNLESFVANNNQFNFIDPRLFKKLMSAKVIDLRNGNCIDENYHLNGGDGDIVKFIGKISLDCIIDDDDDDDDDKGFCKGRK